MNHCKHQKLTLEALERRVDKLPLLPAILYQMMKLDQEQDNFYSTLVDLIKKDPPLASLVLRLANCAANAPAKPVMNLHDALIRIGVNKVFSLITAVSVAKVFTPSKPGHRLLWQHSIETASFSEFIAENMPGLHIDKDMAYSCGLLHDIGRFVLFECAPRALDATDATGWDSPAELPEVEERLFGFSHAEVGYISVRKWQLPKIVESLVRHHHHYNLYGSEHGTEAFRNLLMVVQFADFISVMIEKNPEWRDWSQEERIEKIKTHCINSSWVKLPLPLEQLSLEMANIQDVCLAMVDSLALGHN